MRNLFGKQCFVLPRRKFLGGLAATVFDGLAPKAARAEEPYDYPFINPHVATVIGTPSLYAAQLPAEVPKQTLGLTVFPERPVPEVFWYHNEFRFSVVRQRGGAAPLIFNIAGTGASYNSSLMQVMERAFYQAGFHVISLTSPTHSNFITTASRTQVPGLFLEDARDLYRVMQDAYIKVAPSIRVSDYYLCGYSLGGAQAAFVTKLDDEIGAFGFKKALMINPPVSLYNSIVVLDEMIDAIPGGAANFNAVFDSLLQRFAAVYREEDFLELSSDFLFHIFKKDPPDEENLQAVIALAFRFFAANLLFTSDVLTRSGVVVQRGLSLSSTDSLTRYFKVSTRLSFADYIEHLLFPYFKALRPPLTMYELIAENSLVAIEEYLRTSDKIGVMTNEDDLILAPGEFDYLTTLFGARSKSYLIGGHLGNLPHRRNVADMVAYFRQGWEPQ